MHQHMCDWHDKYGQRAAPALPREEGAEAAWRGHTTAHRGPEQGFHRRRSFPFDYAPCIPFTSSPCPDTLGMILVYGCAYMRSARRLRRALHANRHTVVLSTHTQSIVRVLGMGRYPASAGAQESSRRIDLYNHKLCSQAQASPS